MVTWIPSIYPLYVSIYTSTMYPMGYLKWLLSWFSWIYLIFVPVQFKLKPVKPLSSLVPYTHIYIHNILSNSPSDSCWRRCPQPVFQWVGATARIFPLNWALVGKLRTHHRDSDEKMVESCGLHLTRWNQMEPDGRAVWKARFFDLREKCICHFA